jgi:hypothetical protein
VVAAVHHAADAVALLAETEHQHLRGAIHAHRILVPTRTLTDDYDIPRPYAPAPSEHTTALITRYCDTSRASRRAAATIGRAAQATHAPSRILVTARAAASITHPANSARHPASPARDTGQVAPPGQEQAPDVPGRLQHTLLRLGVTDPALLDRGAELDQASQRLLIDAADQLPPGHPRPRASTLSNTAASAALLNYALAATDPRATQLIRHPSQPERNEPEPDLASGFRVTAAPP